ncbi:hypothetical protein DFH09DRAFT_1076308 [Mycena vulgaris]|nr:hypothetical protein DFH09DRAFT_1076308 [Mycena vulgaris]
MIAQLPNPELFALMDVDADQDSGDDHCTPTVELPPRSIFVKHHLRAGKPNKIIPLHSTPETAATLGPVPTASATLTGRPWAPFQTYADFKFASRRIKRQTPNTKIDEDLLDLRDGSLSKDSLVTFCNCHDMEKVLAAARYSLWVCDRMLAAVSTWFSQEKYLRLNGIIDFSNPLYNEPCTGRSPRRWALFIMFPRSYEKLLNISQDVSKEHGKSLNFLKQHFLSHVIENFRKKGTSRNMNTCISMMDENEETMARIQMAVNEWLKSREEDEKDQILRLSNAESPAHWKLGSADPRITSVRIEAKNQSNLSFRDFNQKLCEYLTRTYRLKHARFYMSTINLKLIGSLHGIFSTVTPTFTVNLDMIPSSTKVTTMTWQWVDSKWFFVVIYHARASGLLARTLIVPSASGVLEHTRKAKRLASTHKLFISISSRIMVSRYFEHLETGHKPPCYQLRTSSNPIPSDTSTSLYNFDLANLCDFNYHGGIPPLCYARNAEKQHFSTQIFSKDYEGGI